MSGRYVHYVASVPLTADRRLWLEDEFLVQSLRKWDPLGGRTERGLLHVWAAEGGARTLDVEDIITITSSPTMKHAKVL